MHTRATALPLLTRPRALSHTHQIVYLTKSWKEPIRWCLCYPLRVEKTWAVGACPEASFLVCQIPADPKPVSFRSHPTQYGVLNYWLDDC